MYFSWLFHIIFSSLFILIIIIKWMQIDGSFIVFGDVELDIIEKVLYLGIAVAFEDVGRYST